MSWLSRAGNSCLGSEAKFLFSLAQSSFQSERIFLHHLFIGAKTDTSNGCMMWVLFSGRKMNLQK
jgi:hypothetical protein